MTTKARARGRTPGADRPRRVARLTRRGWFLLVFGAAAIPISYGVGRRELLYLGCFVVLLPILSVVFIRVRRMRLAVSRSFSPPLVGAGMTATVQLEVANLAPTTSSPANWRDTRPWSPFATEPSVLPSLLSTSARFDHRGSAAQVRYPLVPPHRGVFEIGPLLVDFSDPFGLADGAIIAGSTDRLVVTPAVVPLSDDAVAIAADEGPTRSLQRRSLGGEDDLMTREYRRGDALRRVHWRASAHHGELMVRQEEQRSHAEARLLIDTVEANYRDAGEADADGPQSESFEWAVSLTASLALHLQRSGFLVTVIETGRPQLAALDRPDEFLESLASVALTARSGDEISLLRGVQRPDRSQGSIFVIVSDADPHLVERLTSQRRSFDLAVAFLVSPRQLGVVRTLEEAGWLCVTADPGDAIDLTWLALGRAQEAGRGRA